MPLYIDYYCLGLMYHSQQVEDVSLILNVFSFSRAESPLLVNGPVHVEVPEGIVAIGVNRQSLSSSPLQCFCQSY